MVQDISIGSVWEETARFCRAEFALLLPVGALGFGLPLLMLLLAVPVEQAESGRVVAGPWMLWLVPCGLLSLVGSVAISAMALRPGATVSECLRIAVARLPAGIGLFGFNLAFQLALALPMAALMQGDLALRGAPGVLTIVGRVAALTATIWLFVRVLPVWALLSERNRTPLRAVRDVFAATAGRYRLLLLVRVVGALAGVIAMVVTLVPLSALCALVGMATGATAAAAMLSYVGSAAIFAALATLWTVYVARLYRRIAPSIGI